MTAACPACAAAPLAAETAGAATGNEVVLSLPSIHCAGCIGTVERTLNALPGVRQARVNLSRKRVAVATDLPDSDLVAALEGAGFEAHPLNTTALGQAQDPASRDLLLRLGVAGFAMMNVMLLSVAVWSGAADATRDLFHLISAAITLPVVAFSAQPFFRNAWSGLRVWRLNMDVPISLAIVLAAGMSLYESLMSGHHAYFDAALALTFFLLIGRYLDQRTRAAARSAARDLAALEVHRALRFEGDATSEVPLEALRVGDRLLVPTGVRVPVDGTLLDAAITDRSFLNGESAAAKSAAGCPVQAGEVNLGAPFRLTATAVGEDTTLRRMTALVETAENARNRYTTLADRAAAVYAPAVHLLALVAFLGWWGGTGDLRLSINVAIAVLIITCPCALGLAVPAVSTAAIGKLYSMGFLVKSGTALERLAEVGRVYFDKTGTLTVPGIAVETGVLSDRDRGVALALARSSAHPVSRAVAAELSGAVPAPVTDIVEIPGLGVAGMLDGEPVFLGRKNGALVLSVGDGDIVIPQNQRLRPGAHAAVQGLRATYALSLLSGDRQDPVREVAEALEIAEAHAEASPEFKHALLSQPGTKAAMIGDGLNDAASLAAAHASIAPSSALDAARNAADVVMLSESLENLPRVFATARKAVHLSRQNFNIATIYNLTAVPIALAGFATPLLAALSMSISSITVLLNALRVRVDS